MIGLVARVVLSQVLTGRSTPRLRHERDRIQHKLLALDLWPFRVMKERALIE